MKKLYIVYQTNAWHSTASQELVGIYSTLSKAIDHVVKKGDFDYKEVLHQYMADEKLLRLPKNRVKKEAQAIIKNMLEYWYQTQGLETNYIIESIPCDKWLQE